MGFEPTPFRTCALSMRLRPLDHVILMMLLGQNKKKILKFIYKFNINLKTNSIKVSFIFLFFICLQILKLFKDYLFDSFIQLIVCLCHVLKSIILLSFILVIKQVL